MSSQLWGSFEHVIWKNLCDSELRESQSFVLTISGGLDSMVLLEVMHKLKPKAKFKVLHYHHGPTADSELLNYRNECLQLVKQRTEYFKAKHNTSFVTLTSEVSLPSEENCRNSRWSFFNSQLQPSDVVVTAHHLDDRLETILIKLTRGSSLDGVAAFKMWNKKIFRPFLNVSKVELLEYAQINNIKWLDDPSNNQMDYLRNWMRKEWLPLLEKKLEGGRVNLAKSLIKIVEQSTVDDDFVSKFEQNSSGRQLNRNWYQSLSANEKIRCLALLLKQVDVHQFTSGQLQEIRKRLDKNQKELTFEILGIKWVINATQVVLQFT
jgi:tRNA(Ile)-lysidine synthase